MKNFRCWDEIPRQGIVFVDEPVTDGWTQQYARALCDADIGFWADIGKPLQCPNCALWIFLKVLICRWPKNMAYRDDWDKTVPGDNPLQRNAHSGRYFPCMLQCFQRNHSAKIGKESSSNGWIWRRNNISRYLPGLSIFHPSWFSNEDAFAPFPDDSGDFWWCWCPLDTTMAMAWMLLDAVVFFQNRGSPECASLHSSLSTFSVLTYALTRKQANDTTQLSASFPWGMQNCKHKPKK